jgi:hypothetical protein
MEEEDVVLFSVAWDSTVYMHNGMGIPNKQVRVSFGNAITATWLQGVQLLVLCVQCLLNPLVISAPGQTANCSFQSQRATLIVYKLQSAHEDGMG